MSDDKEAKAPDKAATKQKGKMMPLILVVVGAVLGGAGVVFLAPKQKAAGPVGPPPPRLEIVHYPDPMEFRFNPKSDKGVRSAKVVFKLDIELDANKKTEIDELIRTRWERSKSRVLLLLKDQPYSVFGNGSKDLVRLSKEIVDELTASLFPDGQANVKDIIYTEVVLVS